MAGRILVLSVTVGNGHIRAAEALKTAAGAYDRNIAVEILDTFRYASPFLEKMVLGTYLEMLKFSPALYNFMYRQSEQESFLSGVGKLVFNGLVSFFVAPKLERYLEKFQPDVVVCTHPFPVGVISQIKGKGRYTGAIFVTLTDFTVHSFWIFPGVDGYFIGDEALLPECASFALSREQVLTSGIPIDPAFCGAYNQGQLKAELDLRPDLPVLLLTGGGLGLGRLEAAVRAISASVENCQLLVVAGANEKLRERLAQLAPEIPCPMQVHGFVNDIHRFMAAADLLIGKPGGLSCAEAMAMGLPVFIVDPLPGQEERNAMFLTRMGAGVRVSLQELAAAVGECLSDPGRLAGMTRAAATLGKPQAARDAILTMVANGA